MNAQSVGVRALRQAAANKPNTSFFSHNLPRLALASRLQTRGAATQQINESDAQSLLASQRRLRPVSPHLRNYDPKQTFFSASIWTRITGNAFSGGLYVFAAAYLAAPLTGWHLESASLVESVAGLSAATKTALKMALAWPFAYHFLNGTRQLVWDTARGFEKSVIKTGNWTVWASSVVAALGLVFLL